MAIASIGLGGSGISGVASATLSVTGSTNHIDTGRAGVLFIASDNLGNGSDGDLGEVTSVTGGTGTWSKLGEWSNVQTGAATGVTCSVWLFVPSGSNPVTNTYTINFNGSPVDKCAILHVFSCTNPLALDTGVTGNPNRNATDGANGFGSVSFSGASSANRLYFRGLAKEANSTTALTPSTSFTATGATRSRNNTLAVLVRGEFRINTSTGETSDPTMAVAGDTAGVFVALKEQAASSQGPVGVATETDSAQALARLQILATGQAADTETALALGAVSVRAIGVSTEGDSALALTSPPRVEAATESDAALALAGVQLRAVGLASSDNQAQALGARSIRPTGFAAEADTAAALAGVQVRPAGLATESHSAQALAAVAIRAAGIASEEDQAQGLSAGGAAPVGLAAESDAATALQAVQIMAVGLAGEIGQAQGLAGREVRILGSGRAAGSAAPMRQRVEVPVRQGSTSSGRRGAGAATRRNVQTGRR